MAKRKLNILVAGGYDATDPRTLTRPMEDIVTFVQELGREIVSQGHTLLTGCRTQLDLKVAEAAATSLLGQGIPTKDVCNQIISYVNQGTEPIHSFGSIRQSELVDWELGGRDLNPPEIIREADVIVLIGGFRGTFRAANWARIERKPLLPVAFFGGAAQDVCVQEAKRVDTLYAGNVTQSEYESVLKSLSRDWRHLAGETVSLAGRLASSREVFIVMSFQTLAAYKDLRRSIEAACKLHSFQARRVDEAPDNRRIIPEIVRGVRHCAFVVADVTEAKPNVYWELGLASGMDKDVIVTAKKGTLLPFDINDVPVIFWDSFSEFEEQLAQCIERLASRKRR
jgi:hypothetical protein